MAVVRQMPMTSAAREGPRRMYERIGAFLFDQRLEPTPANFTFAFHLLGNPNGPLARAVANLTDAGIRLTQKDIAGFGNDQPDPPPAASGDSGLDEAREKHEGLVAQTQLQVEGFADVVSAIRSETQDFSRDLAASAAAIDRTREGQGQETSEQAVILDEVARITAAMLERVHAAETRLDSATQEANDLRTKLEEARENARRDPLTELPNRRAFEEAYAAMVSSGGLVCMAVCDIDHFKQVNDKFGHAVGDRVLRMVANALSDACKGHLVARYGGEEFAVLFSGMTLERARMTLEGARTKVQSKRYRLRDSDQPLGEVTFSAGLTSVKPEEPYGDAFQRADGLCYLAKSTGRNCIKT